MAKIFDADALEGLQTILAKYVEGFESQLVEMNGQADQDAPSDPH